MALDIKGKAALVTGGGSGICLQLSKKLLAAGCNVLIVDLVLRPEARELIAGNGHPSEARCQYVSADVTKWKELRDAFDQALRDFGRLDIVVPGAGVFEPPSSNFWQFDNELTVDTDGRSSYRSLDINVHHPIRATQLAIDSFLRQKLDHGVVCCVTSIAAQLTLLPVPLYCTSKHAVSAFVRSMAPLEEAKNIRVNAVAPGIVRTPIWSAQQLAWVDETTDTWVTTEQVADVMIELITKKEYVGGTVLEVGADRVRKVEELNDPGPAGKGHVLSKLMDAFVNAFELLEKNFGR